MDDAVGEDAGLTGARAGDDEHRAFGVQDGLPLGRIQLREVLLGRRDGPPRRWYRGSAAIVSRARQEPRADRRRSKRGRAASFVGRRTLSIRARRVPGGPRAVTGTANVRPQVGLRRSSSASCAPTTATASPRLLEHFGRTREELFEALTETARTRVVRRPRDEERVELTPRSRDDRASRLPAAESTVRQALGRAGEIVTASDGRIHLPMVFGALLELDGTHAHEALGRVLGSVAPLCRDSQLLLRVARRGRRAALSELPGRAVSGPAAGSRPPPPAAARSAGATRTSSRSRPPAGCEEQASQRAPAL